MRRLLLWMARNAWLRDRVPKWWFVRRAVLRFMPGETVDSALTAAQTYQAGGIGALFTRLGENLTEVEQADAVAEHYSQLIGAIASRGLDGEISLKLTQLGFDLDPARAVGHFHRLAADAAAAGQAIWIDMEASSYVESTIELYERVKASHSNIGICLQAYLRRTAGDIQRLLPIAPAIRLVKGAYAEPPSVAYQSRGDVDANYLALVVSMLDAQRDGHPIRVALGTHDVALVEQSAEHGAALGLPKTAFEVQMLYGIRVDQQRRLAREGFVVKSLISYGDAWYPWYVRRLAERPANVIFVLRQVLPF